MGVLLPNPMVFLDYSFKGIPAYVDSIFSVQENILSMIPVHVVLYLNLWCTYTLCSHVWLCAYIHMHMYPIGYYIVQGYRSLL